MTAKFLHGEMLWNVGGACGIVRFRASKTFGFRGF